MLMKWLKSVSVGISAGAEEDLGELKGRVPRAFDRYRKSERHGDCAGGRLSRRRRRLKKLSPRAPAAVVFVLSDFHGEIPFLVDDEILSAAAEAVRRCGTLPVGLDGP